MHEDIIAEFGSTDKFMSLVRGAIEVIATFQAENNLTMSQALSLIMTGHNGILKGQDMMCSVYAKTLVINGVGVDGNVLDGDKYK